MSRSERGGIYAAAVAVLAFRRSRSRFLPAELFAEPAWDLLLEVFIADTEGCRLTAQDVSERSNISPSVMSRWLMHLAQSGVIIGGDDGDLGATLTMSAGVIASMEAMLEQSKFMLKS